MVTLIARRTAVASSSSISSTTAPGAAVLAWGWPSVGVGSAVALRRIVLLRWSAIGGIVGVRHAAATSWWRGWSSGEVSAASAWRDPAGRHGWHTTRRGHKAGVQMGRKGIGSMATAAIVHTATTAVSQGGTAKRAARVLRFGLDSVNVCVIESRGWELDASKEHRLVDVCGFWHFVVDTVSVSKKKEAGSDKGRKRTPTSKNGLAPNLAFRIPPTTTPTRCEGYTTRCAPPCQLVRH